VYWALFLAPVVFLRLGLAERTQAEEARVERRALPPLSPRRQ
jgi:hypothetical protein